MCREKIKCLNCQREFSFVLKSEDRIFFVQCPFCFVEHEIDLRSEEFNEIFKEIEKNTRQKKSIFGFEETNKKLEQDEKKTTYLYKSDPQIRTDINKFKEKHDE